MKKYDSRKDTKRHIKTVAKFLKVISKELCKRGKLHDKSKLLTPEKDFFDVYTPKLKSLTYGSEEYKRNLEGLQIALKHHYAINSHHPEHYVNGIADMTLVDVIEMLCDWKAATLRHDNGNINKSLEINKERFNMSEQLVSVLKNTVDAYF